MSLHRLHLLIISIALLLSGSAFGTVPSQTIETPAPELISGDFGVFNPPGSGKPAFVPSKVVPLVPDQSYGWIIKLRTDKLKIKWREEFTLPKKPNTWGPAEPRGTRNLSSDGRTSTTERVVTPDRGVIFNGWAVAPGDPKGRYVIRVFVEGYLVKVFEFDVQ